MYQVHNNGNPLLIASSSSTLPPQSPPTYWTFAEDKIFEQCLVLFPDGTPDRWQSIAARIPGKSAEEIKQHFDILVHDVHAIQSDRIPTPNYPDVLVRSNSELNSNNQINFGLKSKQHGDGERKKGVPWTENEHRLFLRGLREFGKGDWRSISRCVVITRTATQVASHAQKYFLRRSSMKEKKRSSIHDITMDDSNLMDALDEQNMVLGPVGTAQPAPPSSHLVGEFGYPMQR
ncbi:hypothetical protein V6N13_095639 [Hibiscus sabdariffa]|uniref:Uncharacterized protein n=2 Tax=Hibiscus sabdariffa TaxID=183260 RepID=A0ABR1ZHH1_9ROSI